MAFTRTHLLPLWAPYAIIFLGFWLLTCSVTFGYSDSLLALNEKICGILFILLGWRASRKGDRKAPLTPLAGISLIGLWLQLAPLLWRIPNPAGYSNNTLIGVLAIFFSVLLSSESKKGSIPPGFSYNPSTYVQRFPVALLALICWFLSRYLAAYQLGFIETIWDPFFKNGTLQVITSKISRSLPLPDAGLGALAYTLEFLLCCHGDESRWRTTPWLVLSFGFLVIPVGIVSILLILLQPLLVHAWCTICLLTALLMLIMITLTLDEVKASVQMLRQAKKGFWHILWKGIEERSEISNSHEISLQSPALQLINAFFWGLRPSWRLTLAAMGGLVLFLIPSFWNIQGSMAVLERVVGMLAVVISVMSFATTSRLLAYALGVLSGILILISLLFGS